MVNSIKYCLGDKQAKNYNVLIEVNMEVSDESDKGNFVETHSQNVVDYEMERWDNEEEQKERELIGREMLED